MLEHRFHQAHWADARVHALAAPVKLADGTVAKYIGVQVDVTRTTEGSCSAFADGTHIISRVMALLLTLACFCLWHKALESLCL